MSRTIIAVTVGALLLAACGGGAKPPTTTTAPAPLPAPTQATTTPPTTAAPTTTSGGPAVQAGVIPQTTGLDLRAAEALLEDAGFNDVATQDASGQGRTPLIRRNWTVCRSKPTAGSHAPTGQAVILDVVKVDEHCP